jgi:hypothetical protein
MAYVYPTIALHGNFNRDGETWDQIVDVIQGSEEGLWGMQGDGVQDRLAGTDYFRFEVRNDAGCSGGAGYYTPGHANMRAGWGVGLPLLLSFSFDGHTKYFFARIPKGGISVDPNAFGPQRVEVLAHGFGEQLAIHELKGMSYETNVNLVQVAQAILANMPIQPRATQFGAVNKIFPAGFDTLKAGDKALEELAKAVISEWGYAYTKRDRTVGETFVIEGAYSRNSISELSCVPVASSEAGFLLQEGGGYMLLEDGGRQILEDTVEANLGNTMLLDSPETEDGGDLINYARARVFPRSVQEDVTLFALTEPFFLGPGEERSDIYGPYRDPDGRNSNNVSAKEVTVVAEMNAQQDMAGADLSAYLEVTSAPDVSEVAFNLVRNNHPTLGGWVMLAAEGDGVFTYTAIDRKAEDADSIEQHGRLQEDVDLHYLVNPLEALAFAEWIVAKHKDPRMRARRSRFLANTSAFHMLAFIFLDIGSRFYQEQSLANVAGDFFIQGVHFTVGRGGLLHFTWYTKEAEDDLVWELGTSALEVDNALAFG